MVFHALTFAGSRGSCLNTRPPGRVFKYLPRDPANVIAMKQPWMMVVLACLSISTGNCDENAPKLHINSSNATANQHGGCRPRWLSWMRRPTGDQEVAGSSPVEVGNILPWRLIMKYFLRSFSPFR